MCIIDIRGFTAEQKKVLIKEIMQRITNRI